MDRWSDWCWAIMIDLYCTCAVCYHYQINPTHSDGGSHQRDYNHGPLSRFLGRVTTTPRSC